jgi:RNA polymerase sigma-70 factor, ECF subfamily
MIDDTQAFETNRAALLALAYRMLGDMARAEDAVQESWVRWQNRQVSVDVPKAFLLKTVMRLCLDELDSARSRREESRSDRLPEPIDLEESGIGRVEMLDQISMAFLVLLQRLTPAERAVFLLHEVFDMRHGEIAGLLGKSEAASRQLLTRAKENVAVEKRALQTSRETHRTLLAAFVRAITSGEQEPLVAVLAHDAVLIADAGPDGARYGRMREIGQPVVGSRKIAAVVRAMASQDVSPRPELRERLLNGEPAVVAFAAGRPIMAILLSVADGQITRLFLHADPERLRHVGPLDDSTFH